VNEIFEARVAGGRRKDNERPEAQEIRREVERTMRRRAAGLTRWMGRNGLEVREVAGHVGISPRTLGAWKAGWEKDRLRVKRIGRKAYQVQDGLREAILAMLGQTGPTASVNDLQELFPQASRRELERILDGYRDEWTTSREKVVMALRWNRAGRVWAMDFTEAPAPIDGEFPYILVIRDLASGYLVLALPCREATRAVVRAALVEVLMETDAPLVLKSDNGSHFTGKEVGDLLAGRGIVHLKSPPGTPRYNGAVEAGIGSLKTRAHFLSARRDRPGEWTCDDMEGARQEANECGRPRGYAGESPGQVWRGRSAILGDEREEFRCRVNELEEVVRRDRELLPAVTLPSWEQENINRVAISRACVALGYLSFRRRRIPIRISDLKRRKIS
jgi:transposase InsO family protein